MHHVTMQAVTGGASSAILTCRPLWSLDLSENEISLPNESLVQLLGFITGSWANNSAHADVVWTGHRDWHLLSSSPVSRAVTRGDARGFTSTSTLWKLAEAAIPRFKELGYLATHWLYLVASAPRFQCLQISVDGGVSLLDTAQVLLSYKIDSLNSIEC